MDALLLWALHLYVFLEYPYVPGTAPGLGTLDVQNQSLGFVALTF